MTALTQQQQDGFRAGLRGKSLAALEALFNELTQTSRHDSSPFARLKAREKLIILRGARNGFTFD